MTLREYEERLGELSAKELEKFNQGLGGGRKSRGDSIHWHTKSELGELVNIEEV